ncbi:putative DnaJ-like protein subfamily B member 13 [Monocercomonoides exilis]|uniref:putative DnaJ-like protein subfamily B member 13 n=1 Tax=Monocercomonoides exilis TaxID=2049356 RepID=UPI00355A2F51|nr:putative DnaJ-like protein subfamily B member 13 [Monocercomonoides exilis]|eukprot:MONOS_12036.1-p1 / transcript=MONOS_12036.1 / gene=MONOS_12036 / organism=Monocercomonoides_exilis_PA203 / gene_product=DnaJ-like protein subfamily B member 13 / transcript_product=DnaJ-like protein subfamily B member 13 / location=Mono_scaffold00638:13245-14913(+) / protein_length=344 / sequence_SO=supercontig / SO=protein_coding / is_pseudo=false
MDYYQILEVTRDADVATIKRKYKELAQKWHPSLHADNRSEAITKYREVTEAYEVLSQARYRVIYDQYGITGLKKGASNERGEKVGGDYQFISDPDEVFRDAFGRNPFTEFFDFSQVTPSEAKGIFTEFAQMSIPPSKEKAKPVIHDLACSLEELYLGATRRVDYEKQILQADGITTKTEKETATIHIKKGMKLGDEVVFPGVGNVAQNEIQGDVIFRITEKKHPLFKRKDSDLIYTANVTLGQALLGTIVKVTTLDKRILSIPVNEIIHPGYTQIVKGEGMPMHQAPPSTSSLAFSPLPTASSSTSPSPKAKESKKGDLIIRFEITFPEDLTEKQKELVAEAGL